MGQFVIVLSRTFEPMNHEPFITLFCGKLNASGLYLTSPSGNAVKLRICVDRHDSASGDRLLKLLRVLRLLRFLECAINCNPSFRPVVFVLDDTVVMKCDV